MIPTSIGFDTDQLRRLDNLLLAVETTVEDTASTERHWSGNARDLLVMGAEVARSFVDGSFRFLFNKTDRLQT